MIKNKTGQTATEYLIILAVVIVVALIVVGVMGGIPGIENKFGITRTDYCKQLNLSFDNYEERSNSDFDFYCEDVAINNKENSLTRIFVADYTYQLWKNESKQIIVSDDDEFLSKLNTIKANCDSMFIVRCLDNRNNLCVYTRSCKKAYCKGDYIPLEVCLKK